MIQFKNNHYQQGYRMINLCKIATCYPRGERFFELSFGSCQATLGSNELSIGPLHNVQHREFPRLADPNQGVFSDGYWKLKYPLAANVRAKTLSKTAKMRAVTPNITVKPMAPTVYSNPANAIQRKRRRALSGLIGNDQACVGSSGVTGSAVKPWVSGWKRAEWPPAPRPNRNPINSGSLCLPRILQGLSGTGSGFRGCLKTNLIDFAWFGVSG